MVATLPLHAQAQNYGANINDANQALRAGDYARAEQLVRAALTQAEAESLSDDRIVVALSMLGTALRLQGKYTESQPVYERAVSIFERSGNFGDMAYANALNHLGSIYERTAQFELAEQAYQRAVNAFEAGGAAAHPNAASTHGNLGRYYAQRQDFEQAQTHFRHAVEILEALPNPDRQALATAVNNLAVVTENLGEDSEAESLYRRSIAIREAEWGPEDPRLANALANLATFHRRQVEPAPAESLYLRALKIYEVQQPPPIGRMLPLLINLAQNYVVEIEHDKAIAHYQRALAIIEDYGVADEQLYLLVARPLGRLLSSAGDYSRAEPHLINAIELTERLYGDDHEDLAGLYSLYATALNETGRAQQAQFALARERSLRGRPALPEAGEQRAALRGTRNQIGTQTPPDSVGVEVERGRIYRLNDGQLTATPQLIACPRYDPQERPSRQRIEDRYEREPRLDYRPDRVEAVLEIVISVDGQIESRLSKVLRTNDTRANDIILQWVESCRFNPGRIGDRAVRVRIEHPITLTFVQRN